MTLAKILVVISLAVGAAAQTSPPSRDVVIIEGTVRTSKGEAVDNASVVLEEKDEPKPAETMTNKDGTFAFTPARPGTFKVTAKKPGFKDAVIEGLTLSPGEKKRVNLVLEAPGASTMEFDDKPSFTVAGVTGYTAAGGHGSDVSLRTSESLARQTLTLKTEKAKGGVNAQAESKLRAAVAANPKSFTANRELGILYLAANRQRDAIPFLEAANRADNADFSSGYNLAVAYEGAGELDSARRQVQKMLAASNHAALHRLLGEIEEKAGNSLTAVREYESSARLDPSEVNYFEWGAELLLHRAILPATEVFTKGSRLHPQSARMLAGLGAALHASGRYEEAAARICAAADLQPKDELPYLFLGKMEKTAPGPLPCAEEKLARFAHEKPQNALANYYYAVALWNRNKNAPSSAGMQQAEQLLAKAVAIDPKCSEAYVQLGTLHATRGNTPEAIRAYQKATEANPQLGEAHYRLGQAYKRSGDIARAEQEMQAYERTEKTQTAEVERQRRELHQFLVVLKDTSQ